jgi:hypothetical protein
MDNRLKSVEIGICNVDSMCVSVECPNHHI